MTRVLLIIALVAIALPVTAYLAYFVHCTLERLCEVHARRFCRRKGLEVRRSRAWIAFEKSGAKTEFTIVELDCLDGQKQRKLIRLLVWLFGVRAVLEDELYPDSHDEKWPQVSKQSTQQK